MWNYIYIYVFLLSVVLSLALTKAARGIALRFGIIDTPSERKVHQEPKALLGGLGIYFAFIAAIAGNILIVYACTRNPNLFDFLPQVLLRQLQGVQVVWRKLGMILTGATLMMMLGLADDIWNIRFSVKLAGQVVLALLLVWSGVRVSLFIQNVYVSWFISVLWIVGITNAFNLLDNMDGLSAGVGMIATVIFFTVSVQQGQFFVSAILITLAGSLLGFLRYNFHPSRIFMGDAGSLFLGYTLASLTLLNTYYSSESPTLFPVIMPLLILGVPIFDTFSVIFLRLKAGESVFKADRRHFSHRLVALGMTQRQAVLLVYLVSFCVGINAILLRSVETWGALIILIQAVGILGLIICLEVAGRKRINNG